MVGNIDRQFSPEEERLLTRLEKVIDKVAGDVSKELIAEGVEEPDISARVAQAIQTELEHHRLTTRTMAAEVSAHSTTSRGKRSTEARAGIDLYLSILRYDDGKPFSKGILIQSKLGKTLRRDHKRLRNQCNRMIYRTDESFVLVFDEHGAHVIPAKRATYPELPLDFRREKFSLGKLIADGLRCQFGDRRWGRIARLPRPEGVRVVMETLRARNGLSVDMRS
jgi:hypothetical protein